MEAASKARSGANGRGRRATRVSGDDRERAILETAERLLEEKPLSDISVDDLAKGAGISRPTFYFYFASKDAVVMTIVERLVGEATGSREEVLTALAESGPRAGLRKALENLYAAFRSRPGVVRAGADMRATNHQEARDLWTQVMEGWVDDVTAMIEFERERGAAPKGQPAREMAIALVQMNERVQYATLLDEFQQKLTAVTGSLPATIPGNVWWIPGKASSLRFVSEKLDALDLAVEGADAAPSPDARAGIAKVEAMLPAALASWDRLQGTELDALNAQLAAAGQARIVIATPARSCDCGPALPL